MQPYGFLGGRRRTHKELLDWLAVFRPGLSARCRRPKALKALIAGKRREAEKSLKKRINPVLGVCQGASRPNQWGTMAAKAVFNKIATIL
jgi:hypothetical protein